MKNLLILTLATLMTSLSTQAASDKHVEQKQSTFNQGEISVQYTEELKLFKTSTLNTRHSVFIDKIIFSGEAGEILAQRIADIGQTKGQTARLQLDDLNFGAIGESVSFECDLTENLCVMSYIAPNGATSGLGSTDFSNHFEKSIAEVMANPYPENFFLSSRSNTFDPRRPLIFFDRDEVARVFEPTGLCEFEVIPGSIYGPGGVNCAMFLN
jgi:hypothetical protein